MNPRSPIALATGTLLSLSLTGCEAVEAIFKAGVWVGVLAVVGLAVVAVMLMRLVRR